jgi:hypothetical protein
MKHDLKGGLRPRKELTMSNDTAKAAPARGRPIRHADPRNIAIDLIPPDAICAEIGSWKGDFAARIVKLAGPRELHLIDPWRFNPAYPARWYGGNVAKSQADMDAICLGVRSRFADNPEVRIHRCGSLDGSPQFLDCSFDWVYIDGDHSRQAVRDDLHAWYPKVKPGGFLVCDDYLWKDEFGAFSVKAAVDEFIAERAQADFEGALAARGQYIMRTPELRH